MKVIFIKDLVGHGKKGEVKEVKKGFGTNYLIKNGYVVLATEGSLKRLNEELKETKVLKSKELESAKKLAREFQKLKLVFPMKTGLDDKVFGSINNNNIVSALEEKGFSIDKKKVNLKKPLVVLGLHLVTIELHKEVVVTIEVELVKES